MKVPPGSVQICQPYKFKALRVQTKTRSKISMNIYAEAFLTILRENQKEASEAKEERMMFFRRNDKDDKARRGRGSHKAIDRL